MLLVIVVVAVVVLLATWLTWTAGRLDRLHARVNAAWAALDAQLVRRAAAAAELARYGLDGSSARGRGDAAALRAVLAATAAARTAGEGSREATENALSTALRDAWADPSSVAQVVADRVGAARWSDLETSMTKVVLARRFHNDAVRDTLALRGQRHVRLCRLAGRAPQPGYFEIDDSTLSDPAGSPQPGS